MVRPRRPSVFPAKHLQRSIDLDIQRSYHWHSAPNPSNSNHNHAATALSSGSWETYGGQALTIASELTATNQGDDTFVENEARGITYALYGRGVTASGNTGLAAITCAVKRKRLSNWLENTDFGIIENEVTFDDPEVPLVEVLWKKHDVEALGLLPLEQLERLTAVESFIKTALMPKFQFKDDRFMLDGVNNPSGNNLRSFSLNLKFINITKK